MRKELTRYVFAACCLFAGSAHCQAGVVTFGSGANQFNMEFVTIGNPGNAADTDYYAYPKNWATLGSVGYEYEIGKFEVSRDMIVKHNASQALQISLYNMATRGGNGVNKPATGVSWNQAARFVNWLNTSTGNQAAYKFADGSSVNDNIQLWKSGDAGYDSSNPYRNSLAKYALPSYNEWYKAAYYDPNNSTYYDFPNGSNTAPLRVASGTAPNTAVFSQPYSQGPADVDQAGGLSPYGVMGLGGNVDEWNESTNSTNPQSSYARGIRGGTWYEHSPYLSVSEMNNFSPNKGDISFGFRVVSLSTPGGGGDGGGTGGEVPEPTSMAIFALGSLGIALRSRFRK